jgi:hypothetical protein
MPNDRFDPGLTFRCDNICSCPDIDSLGPNAVAGAAGGNLGWRIGDGNKSDVARAADPLRLAPKGRTGNR